MKRIVYKIHESKQTTLLAAADSEIVGKTLKGEECEFFVNPRFYNSKETNSENLKKIMQNCSAGNLIGKNTVKAAVELGLVKEKNIIYFEKVPHAQYVIMPNF